VEGRDGDDLRARVSAYWAGANRKRAAFARLAGVDRKTVEHFISGAHPTTPNNVAKIRAAMAKVEAAEGRGIDLHLLDRLRREASPSTVREVETFINYVLDREPDTPI
jgi:DNA-binding transcriptional regulator YdaS (Cro superfamily)